jgi:hypothetical protein
MTVNHVLEVGDRVRFDAKQTSWLVRKSTDDGRFVLLTAVEFGKVLYSVIDFERLIRGPVNVLGGGMGIFTTSGPDEAIDETLDMLQGKGAKHVGGHWEISRRRAAPVNITALKRGAKKFAPVTA